MQISFVKSHIKSIRQIINIRKKIIIDIYKLQLYNRNTIEKCLLFNDNEHKQRVNHCYDNNIYLNNLLTKQKNFIQKNELEINNCLEQIYLLSLTKSSFKKYKFDNFLSNNTFYPDI